jgi:hypothetical protein
VRFVVHKVALGQGFIPVILFLPVIIIPHLLHTHLHLSTAVTRPESLSKSSALSDILKPVQTETSTFGLKPLSSRKLPAWRCHPGSLRPGAALFPRRLMTPKRRACSDVLLLIRHMMEQRDVSPLHSRSKLMDGFRSQLMLELTVKDYCLGVHQGMLTLWPWSWTFTV